MKTTSNKRILALAISIMLVLGMMPMSVFAADIKEYNLWVGGVQFTSENLEINSADNADIIGEATYNPNTNTLTLDSFNYEGEGYNNAAIYYNGTNMLNLELEGESSVTHIGGTDYSYGLYASDLSVFGDGSLTANGGDLTKGTEDYSYGVFSAGKITVLGGALIGNGGTVGGEGFGTSVSYGVRAEAEIEVYGSGTLQGTGGTSKTDITNKHSFSESYGVSAKGNIKVSDNGLIEGTGNASTASASGFYSCVSNSYGLYAEADIEIFGSGTITGTSGTSEAAGNYFVLSYSQGVSALNGSITIHDNGSLIGNSDVATAIGKEGYFFIYNYSDGVYADNITVSDNGSLTGIGSTVLPNGSGYNFYSSTGVEANNITISSGVVIACGETQAFYTAPAVSDTYTNAELWYGDDESAALNIGAQDISKLAENHSQKYVMIKIYNLYVGGVQVTSANADNILGDGKVSYDTQTATLTLTDASINNADGIGIKATGDLTISGSGSVTGSTYGIYVDGMLSITSDSVIEMTGTDNYALAVRDGILANDVIVSVPKNYAIGSVGEENYTTYGTSVEEDDEYKFIPAKTVRFELGYAIYFDVGESMDCIEYQEIVAGDKVERPADPTLSGYTFGGWYTDDTYTVAYDFDTPVTEDLWLYAKWEPVATDDGDNPSDNTQTDNDTEENNKPNDSTQNETHIGKENNKPTDSTQNETNNGEKDNTTSDVTSPATGDNSNLWLWVALLFIGGGLGVTLTIVDRKKRYTAKR